MKFTQFCVNLGTQSDLTPDCDPNDLVHGNLNFVCAYHLIMFYLF